MFLSIIKLKHLIVCITFLYLSSGFCVFVKASSAVYLLVTLEFSTVSYQVVSLYILTRNEWQNEFIKCI